jgi:hypothetical protein
MPDTSYLRTFDEGEANSSPVTFTAIGHGGPTFRETSAKDASGPFFRGFAIGLALVVPAWAFVIWAVFFR